ncbi:MAG: toll/interleukin-1 receptor domain-containing protein [Syntrophales bacterium LBB04]|nr:toll/interleukin-1 receptor domain-containing protein [Syntrophales bacterium LBB04]
MTSDFSVFISHVSDDESIAIAIRQFIEKVFLNATVFVAGRDLIGGEVWVKEIRDKLRTSRVIVSIITPFSQNSSWVLFESGAGFLDSRTIPLCGDGITIEALKPPLKLLQARALNQEGLKNLVRDIARLAELSSRS